MAVTKSILIIDDEDLILNLLTQAFSLNGYKVFTAKNGIDGLRTFRKERADIVLTDIKMPDLSGYELITHIRKESPHTKVALMTGGDDEIVSDLIKEGKADHFFQKPFNLSYLCKTLS